MVPTVLVGGVLTVGALNVGAGLSSTRAKVGVGCIAGGGVKAAPLVDGAEVTGAGLLISADGGGVCSVCAGFATCVAGRSKR